MCRRVGLIILLMVLVACRAEVTSNPRLEAPAHTIPATVTMSVYPLADYRGHLVYVQGERLMLFDQPPQVLAEGIAADLVYLSPDQRHLLFSQGQRRNHTLYRANVETQEHLALVNLSVQTWGVHAWSVDGAWVVIQAGTRLDLVALDGSQHLPDIGSSLAEVFWTIDGRLLLFERDSAGAYTSASIVDPQAATQTALDVTTELVSGDWDAVLAVLAAQDIVVAATAAQLFGMRYSLQSLNAGGLCTTWHVVALTGFSVYSVEETYRLSHLSELATGDWVFLQWVLPECALGIPEVALLRLSGMTNRVETIITDIYGGIGFNQLSYSIPLYTLAPSRQSIIWVGGGVDTYKTSLHLLNLVTQEQVLLIEEQLDQRSAGDTAFIRGVFWLIP